MRRTAFVLFVLLLSAGGVLRADDDAVKNCISAWVTSCAKDCATAKCVAQCTTQAHAMCTKDITQPQHVFNGPVTTAPATECPIEGIPVCANPTLPTGSCSTVSGTVADPAFFGGTVTIYVICPAGKPDARNESVTTTVLGRTLSSITDGTFTMTVTNQCSGQTGCYAIIAVGPPAGSGDPGWTPCTGGGVCPNP